MTSTSAEQQAANYHEALRATLEIEHLAREARVELSIDDFDRINERTPLLCDLQPGGQYVAVDLFQAGGVPLVVELGVLLDVVLVVLILRILSARLELAHGELDLHDLRELHD